MLRLRLPIAALALALALLGCDNPASPADAGSSADASAGRDAGADRDAGPLADAGPAADAGPLADAGPGVDAGPSDAGPPDAGPPDAGPPDAGPPDAGPPAMADFHIHIDVSNTCRMTVDPMEIDIPPGQTAYFDWHNHSRDYPVDVWMSYGGGFTDLAPGATWDEPIGHCIGPRVGDEWADITTACSSHRFLIHCR